MRAVNVPMRLVLGLPFPTPLGDRLMLAFIEGRKTGRVYRQPLSYARDGEQLITPGGGNWKRNLRPDHVVRLRVRGRDRSVLPEVIADPEQIRDLLDVLRAGNPRAESFIPVRKGPDGRPDPAGLGHAVEMGFRMVRWHPAPEPS
jgi:hypothetical protein